MKRKILESQTHDLRDERDFKRSQSVVSEDGLIPILQMKQASLPSSPSSSSSSSFFELLRYFWHNLKDYSDFDKFVGK